VEQLATLFLQRGAKSTIDLVGGGSGALERRGGLLVDPGDLRAALVTVAGGFGLAS